MGGIVSVPPALLVEAVTLFDGRGSIVTKTKAFAGNDHLVLDADIAKSYLRGLLAADDSATLRNASQLMRQLRLISQMDGEDVVRRLVDANQWVHAEQFAVAASEEEAAEGGRATEGRQTARDEAETQLPSGSMGASTSDRRRTTRLSRLAARRQGSHGGDRAERQDHAPRPADDVASVRRVAAAPWEDTSSARSACQSTARHLARSAS